MSYLKEPSTLDRFIQPSGKQRASRSRRLLLVSIVSRKLFRDAQLLAVHAEHDCGAEAHTVRLIEDVWKKCAKVFMNASHIRTAQDAGAPQIRNSAGSWIEEEGR